MHLSQHMCILQKTSANCMWLLPRPTHMDEECVYIVRNIVQRYKASSMSFMLGHGMCTSGKRCHPTTFNFCQGLQASNASCAHQLDHIIHVLSTSSKELGCVLCRSTYPYRSTKRGISEATHVVDYQICPSMYPLLVRHRACTKNISYVLCTSPSGHYVFSFFISLYDQPTLDFVY